MTQKNKIKEDKRKGDVIIKIKEIPGKHGKPEIKW